MTMEKWWEVMSRNDRELMQWEFFNEPKDVFMDHWMVESEKEYKMLSEWILKVA